MILNSMLRLLLAIIFILGLNNTAFSQKQNYIGLNFTSEYTKSDNIRVGVGLTCERQFTLHSGFETGLFFRTYTSSWFVTINANGYSQKVIQNYISIPLLYKFYSGIVNIAAGPSFDYFSGWRQSNPTDLKIVSYSIKPKVDYGLIVKISKPICIGDKFILEPEIRYNPIFKYERYYLGVGIAAKYRL